MLLGGSAKASLTAVCIQAIICFGGLWILLEAKVSCASLKALPRGQGQWMVPSLDSKDLAFFGIDDRENGPEWNTEDAAPKRKNLREINPFSFTCRWGGNLTRAVQLSVYGVSLSPIIL